MSNCPPCNQPTPCNSSNPYGTNIYINSEGNCTKKQKCEETSTEPCQQPTVNRQLPGFRSNPETATSTDKPKCKEPTEQEVGTGSVTTADRLFMESMKEESSIFETPIIGFQPELGEPTFEELRAEKESSPYLEGIDFKDLEKEDECEEEAESTLPPPNPQEPPPPPPPPPPEEKRQYTSEMSKDPTVSSPAQMIREQTWLSQLVSNVSSQDPDGIGWITPSQWNNAIWDGTPIDPTTLTKAQLCAFIRPNGNYYSVRGLREHFYTVNPFADTTNPTVQEIEDWNLEVIRHFRNLFGNPAPVSNDARLYIECRWSDERKSTTVWDTKYPSGTCAGSTDSHCGESFFPDTTDRNEQIAQAPYNNNTANYPELLNYNERASKSVGIQGLSADIPWSIKLGVVISRFICEEYLTGHPGPFINPTSAREHFGCSWWSTGGGQVRFRGKWY